MKRVFRRSLSLIIVLVLLLPSICFAAPAADVEVLIDNSPLYSDQPPFMYNGRVMVPIRAIFESLALSVAYDESTGTMTAAGKLYDNSIVTVVHKIGSYELSVNGKAKTFDTPSMRVNSRTLVPVRMIAEAVNAVVEWDASQSKVRITTAYKTKAEFVTYENDRFGYSISYPSVFGSPFYPDNGDGVIVTTADDKGELVVWGSYNALGETSESVLTKFLQEVPNAKGDIIEDILNLYYTTGEYTCFVDYIVSQQTITAFKITYPTAQKTEYETYINQLQKTFVVNGIN